MLISQGAISRSIDNVTICPLIRHMVFPVLASSRRMIMVLSSTSIPISSIKELHLVKVPTNDGRYKYSLPADQRFNPQHKLKRTLIDSFVSIDRTDNLLVMKTMPGNANAIGALIDNLEWPEILGTICGDDTILIICRGKDNAIDTSQRFIDML